MEAIQVRHPRKASRLGLFPIITLVCFLSAIIVGLLGTWLQAFGYLPSIGHHELSLQPWIDLVNYPGFVNSLKATVVSGLGATVFSLIITFYLLALSFNSRIWNLLNHALAPLLAIPHAAFAIGFLFLATPSGWILRAISPDLTGLEIPPTWSFTHDSLGISLMIVMVLKEVPFLVLVSLSALSRMDVSGSLAVGRSLGCETSQVWVKIILPQLFPKIRLAVFAVLAYSLSVVDLAQIIGPTIPPTLAVQVFKWFNDPSLDYRLLGSAGATLILILVMGFIGAILLLETVFVRSTKTIMVNGQRKAWPFLSTRLSNSIVLLIVGISALVLLVLIIWSFTWRWRFPDFLPEEWSTRFWMKGLDRTQDPIWNTITTGIAASAIAIILVIGCLENEVEMRRRGLDSQVRKYLWLIYLPLLIPQIAFLFGVQVSLALFHLEGYWLSLVWSHLLFVLPYVFLSLGPIYRGYDQRMSDVAITLCRSRTRAFFRVKLPMLLKPVFFAGAIGFAVSVAQYLPTLFMGAGRFETITTEAVTLASGSDRRIVAVYAICQLALPLLFFLSALLIPRFHFRHRKGMQG